MLVYLNGEYIPRERAMVSVDDRGFVFGDGVYEVTRVCRGALFEGERHVRRLERSLRALEISMSAADVAGLVEISERLLRENDLLEGEATVYWQVTRGAAPRAHAYPAGVRPTVYVSVAPFAPPTALRERGVGAVTYADVRWARCDVKAIALVTNVMAKQYAVSRGAFEAIFVRDGALTEGAHTNVFGVIDGVIRTYPRSQYILPGVTREVVLEVAEERGYTVSELPIMAEDTSRLEELFFTGTATDVLPVVTLDGRPVADGSPGPIARGLYEGLAARLEGAAVGARG